MLAVRKDCGRCTSQVVITTISWEGFQDRTVWMKPDVYFGSTTASLISKWKRRQQGLKLCEAGKSVLI